MNGKLSFLLLNFITAVFPDKETEELEEIKYGIDILITFIFKTLTILIIGYFMGIISYVIITIISLSIAKLFAGGVHAKNDLQCSIISVIKVFTIVFLSLHLNIAAVSKIAIFLISFFILLKNAPADTEEKPYICGILRKRLKLLSLIVSALMTASSIFVFKGVTGNIIILSLLIVCLFTTTVVYKLMGRRFRNYEFFEI